MASLAKAFAGEPHTEVTQKNGKTTILVRAKHYEPKLAKETDEAGRGIALFVFFLSVALPFMERELLGFAGICMFSSFFIRLVMNLDFKYTGQSTTEVFFSDAAIFFRTIRRGKASDWQEFNRSHPHRFILADHDRSREEKDEIDAEKSKNPQVKVARYYTDSWVVCLEYFGQRYEVAEVMGPGPSRRLFERLCFCDDYIRSLEAGRQKIAAQAKDDWSGPTSSIPD